MKKTKSIWKEVKADFTDQGTTSIDAYLSENPNSSGRVIAEVDIDGEVEYKNIRAKMDPYAQEIINQVISDKKDEKQKLVDTVIENLKKDFEAGDYTVLDELLMFIKSKNLVQSLPEERWEEFPEVSTEN
jgi:hypothetical protein